MAKIYAEKKRVPKTTASGGKMMKTYTRRSKSTIADPEGVLKQKKGPLSASALTNKSTASASKRSAPKITNAGPYTGGTPKVSKLPYTGGTPTVTPLKKKKKEYK